ncbi:hypothetical protein FZ983_15350 [Azospirillum sp. B21]|nr:hypothetical protein FZ983_15350 [Azospirillum sp. B21]
MICCEITAKMHKRPVMEKMGARSLPDLVLMAAQLGIPARWRRWMVRKAR